MLTDKSGRLFKSIEDCANTAIRGLLALISPEAGAMGELGHIGCEDEAGRCGTQVPGREGRGGGLPDNTQLGLRQSVHPPLARVWPESLGEGQRAEANAGIFCSVLLPGVEAFALHNIAPREEASSGSDPAGHWVCQPEQGLR